MSSYPSKEYKLLEKIDKNCARSINQSFSKTIGDDCAIRKAGAEDLLFSADTLVEGVHFRLDLMSLKEVGYKAAMVNISDIAAMGGTPDSMLIQLVFPKGTSEEQVDELYTGLGDAVEEYNCPIVGGDLSQGPCWMIAVTITGRASERSLLRSNAEVGDGVWVTGTPGLSAIGLEKLFAGDTDRTNEAVVAHVRPRPQVKIGLNLAEDTRVHAMLDISDGVAKETLTVAKESGVGMELNLPEVVTGKLSAMNPHKTIDSYFLNGGEDYELLFTASPDFVPPSNGQFHKIGEVIAGHQVYFTDSSGRREIEAGGWDHF